MSAAITTPAVYSLLDVTSGFDGAESLELLRRQLKEGADVHEKDSKGATPLLHLCRPLEMDYRYTTDPHFAGAVDDAIIALLQQGADILHEDNQGCNALYFLQSKPELLKKLNDAGLVPKELAVRIPYDTAAFYRYIQKRTQQAARTSHEASREYLIRKYCAPAYDRAENRLNQIISETGVRKKSMPGVKVVLLLDFMRLADRERAKEYVHNLHYWKHGEHFLEEIPSYVLDALNLLEWEVDGQDLRKALQKLDTMLPSSPDEMIDCDAARPMGQLLEMLERNEGDQVLPLIDKYTKCNEANLAYMAYRLLLKRRGLPTPTPDALAACLANKNGEESPTLRRLYECAVVDHALRNGDTEGVDAAMLRRVQTEFKKLKLARHADIAGRLLQGKELTTDSYIIQAAHHSYIELPPPSPRIIMAIHILEHPELFTGLNTEQK